MDSAIQPQAGLFGAPALSSTAQAQALPDDTTLSSLVVNDGSADLTLIPGGTSLDPVSIVDVSHDVKTVTVTATPTNPKATVDYMAPGGDLWLDRPNGLVVELAVGHHNIIIRVTAEDGSLESHKVEVFRAPPATPFCSPHPLDIWCSLVTITQDAVGSYAGYTADMSDFDFTYFDKTLRFQFVSVKDGTLHLALHGSKPIDSNIAAYNNLYLQIGSESFPVSSGCDFGTPICLWRDTGLDWSSATTVTVRLREFPASNPALPPPQGFVARPLLPGQIRLSWWRNINVASHGEINSYQYRYRVRGVNTWTVDWTSVNQTQLPEPRSAEIRNYNKVVLENLGEGTDYEFWARSVDSNSRYSHSVAWLETAIGRQTFSIEADRGPVEEGGDLYFTVSRDQGHGPVNVILRISETGDMLPQEGHIRGYWYEQLDFGDYNTTRRLILETVNDRGGSELDSEVKVEVMSYPLYPDNPDNEHLYLVHPTRGSATRTVTAAEPPTGSFCTPTPGDLWCGVVTVGNEALNPAGYVDSYGYNGPNGGGGFTNDGEFGYLSNREFDVGANSYTIDAITTNDVFAYPRAGGLNFVFSTRPADADRDKLVLHVPAYISGVKTEVVFNFSEADFVDLDGRRFSWDQPAPAYLNWKGKGYIPLRLREESGGSSQGGAAEPLTAAFQGLPASHDGETAFTFRLVFSEAVAVTPEAMRTRVLTVAGGAVTASARVDGESGVWSITVTPDTREVLSISLPPAADCDADGAVCTSDGRALSIGAAHIVGGPGPDTGPAPLTATFPESAYASAQHKGPSDRPQVVMVFSAPVAAFGADTPSVSATGASVDSVQRLDKEGLENAYVFFLTPEDHKAIVFRLHANRACTDGGICTADRQQLSNSPSATVSGSADEPERNTAATGTPTISGTPQVGDELTASTSGIADADGLDNATFSYRWLVDDTAIQGATGSTYTLATADEGEAIKVQVSFTDDAGNEETLTSAATGAVATKPNSPATGAPTISGATDSTYTLSDSGEGKAIKVRVSFTDDEGNEETLTSGATEAVAAAEPTEPPAAPTNLTAVVNDDGTVALSWDAPDDDSVAGYQILRRRPTMGEAKLLVHVADTGGTAITFTDTEVTASIRHVYRVKAINAAGLGKWSNYVRVEP